MSKPALPSTTEQILAAEYNSCKLSVITTYKYCIKHTAETPAWYLRPFVGTCDSNYDWGMDKCMETMIERSRRMNTPLPQVKHVKIEQKPVLPHPAASIPK